MLKQISEEEEFSSDLPMKYEYSVIQEDSEENSIDDPGLFES